MSERPAVVAESLVKEFGGRRRVRALDGVGFAAAPGSVLGLLGPNGAGKTTAVRILSTILAPDAGHAAVLGHDVVAEAPAVRRLIGLAGQYAAVDENLTGRENLHMVGRLCHMSRRAARTHADELLDRFGLAEAGNRTLKTYSGGMRRRLDLAAALVGQPPVLFLDEPTSGLDPQSRQDLWAVIGSLVGAGTTVLLTTQYLEEADRLADRIVVVDHGRVIAEGTPAALKAGMGTSVVSITFADPATVATAVGVLVPLAPRPPVVQGTTVEITVERGPMAATRALRALDRAGCEVVGLTLREPSLDDVFLALTGRPAEASPASSPEVAGAGGGVGDTGDVPRDDRPGPGTGDAHRPAAGEGAAAPAAPGGPFTGAAAPARRTPEEVP